jgi:hypothetical protein
MRCAAAVSANISCSAAFFFVGCGGIYLGNYNSTISFLMAGARTAGLNLP